jgi:hypothetical protein
MSNISDFKSKLSGGGARANQFKVILSTFPSGAANVTEELSFLCKSTVLPGQSITATVVDFRGRQIKLAGDSRAFEDWQMTVINDTSFSIRNSFEKWMEKINNMSTNGGATNPIDYQTDIIVQQLDRDENVLKTYTLINAFPVGLGEIAVSYDTNDTIEDFTVDFAYEYYTAQIGDGGAFTTGDASLS